MGVLKLFELASRMDKVGVTVTRVGLIVVLLWIGGLKAFRYEADGIVPLVANSPIMSDEIQPYVVYRIEDDQMECALWRFKDGQKALALFLSGDAATSFQESANLGAEWKIFC